jgi:hypothetical protein
MLVTRFLQWLEHHVVQNLLTAASGFLPDPIFKPEDEAISEMLGSFKLHSITIQKIVPFIQFCNIGYTQKNIKQDSQHNKLLKLN